MLTPTLMLTTVRITTRSDRKLLHLTHRKQKLQVDCWEFFMYEVYLNLSYY